MLTLIAVATGGAAGSVLRYLTARWVGSPGGLPGGILMVNVSGAMVLGVVATVLLERVHVSEAMRIGLTVGLLGGYTTFSTLSLDSVHLIQDGRWWWGLMNIVVSGAAGLGAAWLGQQVARL